MGLNIKNKETCRLASELARLTGETKTGAVTQALGERLERESKQRGLEAAMVVEGQGGRAAGRALDAFLASSAIATAPITTDQLEIARDAWHRYGKGNHPALNFGDCFAYALASASGEPLLFKGNDFAQTDVVAA